MELRVIKYDSKDYRQMLHLRDEVLRKPLGMRIEDDDLSGERSDILLAAFDDTRMTGCCILTKTTLHTARLRQMAVAEDTRNTGVGTRLLGFAEEAARKNGYTTLTLHARETARKFYEKSGYTVNGTMFTEVSIPHFPMTKSL